MYVHSVFETLNGEVTGHTQCSPALFIRLAGCNLRCSWCDTKRAQRKEDGIEVDAKWLGEQLRLLRHRNLTITGGEPLMQWGEVETMLNEVFESVTVTVETNGTFDVNMVLNSEVPQDISLVVDYKARMVAHGQTWIDPGTLEAPLSKTDVVKFLVFDDEDIIHVLSVLKRGYWPYATHVLSPILPEGSLDEKLQRVAWAKKRALDLGMVLNVQLHKFLWHEEELTDSKLFSRILRAGTNGSPV